MCIYNLIIKFLPEVEGITYLWFDRKAFLIHSSKVHQPNPNDPKKKKNLYIFNLIENYNHNHKS